MAEPRIGVVGATGAVGSVTLELLAERGLGQVRAFASSRSAGTTVPYGGSELVVEEATKEALASGELDLCFFSVGTGPSSELVPAAVAGGAVCVDKSSAFRLTDGVPLVVPEVNGDRAAAHRGHRRQPELLDDPARLRARPAPRGRRTEERARRHLPVRIGRGSRADGGAPLAAGRRRRHRHGLGLRRRRVRRGVEAARRDAEDPRAARPSGQRDLRPRARPRRPLAGGLDRDRAAAVAGRGPRGAGRRARSDRDRQADPAPGGRRRPGAGRPHPGGPRRPGPRPLGRLRQPAQGRGPERDPDRGAAPRAPSARSPSFPDFAH